VPVDEGENLMAITSKELTFAFIAATLAVYLVFLRWLQRRRAADSAKISETLRRQTD
jgi:hypothetical protein